MGVSATSASLSLEERCAPPKRCRTAYNIYYQAERNRIVASLPEPPKLPSKKVSTKKGGRPVPHGKIGFQDLARQISASWKNLSDEERSKYIESARADKERYLEEKRVWQNSVAELERIHSSGSLTRITTDKTKEARKNAHRINMQMNNRFHPTAPPSPGGSRPDFTIPSRSPSPGLDVFEPTPIGQMESIDPYAPIPYQADRVYSQVEAQSLQCISRRLDKDSLQFIVSRLS